MSNLVSGQTSPSQSCRECKLIRYRCNSFSSTASFRMILNSVGFVRCAALWQLALAKENFEFFFSFFFFCWLMDGGIKPRTMQEWGRALTVSHITCWFSFICMKFRSFLWHSGTLPETIKVIFSHPALRHRVKWIWQHYALCKLSFCAFFLFFSPSLPPFLPPLLHHYLSLSLSLSLALALPLSPLSLCSFVFQSVKGDETCGYF